LTDKKTKLFGTDGIRAKAGEFPLDSKTVRTIGASLGRRLAERTGGRTPVIVTGRDTRESGPRIEEDLMAGARASGASVQSAGVITTPGVAYLARVLPADAGVVISASHNPFADNGIKIFDPSGRKLDDVTERQIESDIAKGEFGTHEASDVARATREQDAHNLRDRYLDYLEHEIGDGLSLTDLKIVVDCANGAAAEIAPKLLNDLGAKVIAINNQPNGQNINLNCGSLHIETLQQRVLTERADVGVAFDGDADRALFVDAEGNFVDGDATMWVLANYMKDRDELIGESVVATVMTNLGLEVALRERGIKLSRTDVGDKYVLDELLRSRAALGGEQSGHLIFPRVSLAGDGMITALHLLRVMKDDGESLVDLTRGFVRYPQVLVNVKVREKVPFESVPAIANRAKQVERELGDRGRLLLRYSGTEALARVMIEGEDEAQVRTSANTLADVIRAEIGA
jgi:phosphoglucosamine mutase